jgi:hypothetical protein
VLLIQVADSAFIEIAAKLPAPGALKFLLFWSFGLNSIAIIIVI